MRKGRKERDKEHDKRRKRKKKKNETLKVTEISKFFAPGSIDISALQFLHRC
jgi:hypothetical protein